MVDLVYYRTNLLSFLFLLFYYRINLRLSINFCLFSRDVYLSFCTSLSNPILSVSLSTVPELYCGEVLETFLILSVIL